MYNYSPFGFPTFRRKPYNTFYNSYSSNIPNYGSSYNMHSNALYHTPSKTPHNTSCNEHHNVTYNSNCLKSPNNENHNVTYDSDYSKSSNAYFPKSSPFSSTYDDNVISIFGFDFHFDDLLIIALLFFLYKERS